MSAHPSAEKMMAIDDKAAVLIVNGSAPKRAALSELLAEHGIESTQTATGSSALAAVSRARPSAVVIDVELEDVAGYELCRLLREQHGEAISIIFTSAKRTATIDRVAGLLIGADDYIAEPFEPDELVARIRRCILRSGSWASESGEGTAAEEQLPANGRSLTKREREVLGMLATGMQQPAIAEALVISPNTVSTHIQRLLVKLEVHSRTQAVAVAYRDGLLG